VITEITLALQPLPPPASTIVATIDTLEAAGRAVRNVFATGVTPSMMEILEAR
jgi:glycolate oxidase